MSVKIAAWNIEGRLSSVESRKRGSPARIIEAIEMLGADIVILPESHSEDSVNTLSTLPQLQALGYQVYSVSYQDDMSYRKDSVDCQSSMMLLSKLPVRDFEIIRLGNLRNGLAATVDCGEDQLLKVIGVHLDDRSETTRVRQVADLSNVINQTTARTVVLGDFNAMHGSDLWPSKILRTAMVKALARIVLPSISRRATEMARGEALHLLETSTGLIDADSRHQATSTPKMRGREWMPSLRLIQIDHIFASPDVVIEDFTIAADGGSDHRAIAANVSFK